MKDGGHNLVILRCAPPAQTAVIPSEVEGSRRASVKPSLPPLGCLTKTQRDPSTSPRFAQDDKWSWRPTSRRLLFCALFCTLPLLTAAPAPRYENLVDIQAVDPTIRVDLRYATAANITGHALYPPDTPALVRPTTAARLQRAQKYLEARHYGLKIWDAYRPVAAQMALWRLTHDGSFVADPLTGNGSLHTWGVAVDATLVDAKGHDVAMPSKFDEFTPAAKLHYKGDDPTVKFHLKLLQRAMREGGFYGMRTEWWHFIAYDWKKYAPIREAREIKK